MPAILRKSLPNLFASHVYSQSLAGCDVVVARARSALDPVCSLDRGGVLVLFLRELMLQV